MFSYKVTSLQEAKNRFVQLLEQVVENQEILLINRENGENVALIAESDLKSLIETVALLRSPTNARRLLDAIAESKAGKIQPQSLKELQEELGIEQKKEEKGVRVKSADCPTSSRF